MTGYYDCIIKLFDSQMRATSFKPLRQLKSDEEVLLPLSRSKENESQMVEIDRDYDSVVNL